MKSFRFYKPDEILEVRASELSVNDGFITYDRIKKYHDEQIEPIHSSILSSLTSLYKIRIFGSRQFEFITVKEFERFLCDALTAKFNKFARTATKIAIGKIPNWFSRCYFAEVLASNVSISNNIFTIDLSNLVIYSFKNNIERLPNLYEDLEKLKLKYVKYGFDISSNIDEIKSAIQDRINLYYERFRKKKKISLTSSLSAQNIKYALYNHSDKFYLSLDDNSEYTLYFSPEYKISVSLPQWNESKRKYDFDVKHLGLTCKLYCHGDFHNLNYRGEYVDIPDEIIKLARERSLNTEFEILFKFKKLAPLFHVTDKYKHLHDIRNPFSNKSLKDFDIYYFSEDFSHDSDDNDYGYGYRGETKPANSYILFDERGGSCYMITSKLGYYSTYVFLFDKHNKLLLLYFLTRYFTSKIVNKRYKFTNIDEQVLYSFGIINWHKS